MRKYIFIAAMAVALSGCQKEDLSPMPIETVETAEVETTEVETTDAEEESTEETVETKVIIPDKFEVYTDGEPHYLMYYADEEKTFFNTFTSITAPEQNIKNVSFLYYYVDPKEGELQSVENDTVKINEETKNLLYDYSTLSMLPDNEFHRFGASVGCCGTFSRPFTYEGDEPTIEEMGRFVNESVYVGSDGTYEVKQSIDGSDVYVLPGNSYIVNSDGSQYIYPGFTMMRIKDGMAEGIYCCINSNEKEDAVQIANYTIQTLEFYN